MSAKFQQAHLSRSSCFKISLTNILKQFCRRLEDLDLIQARGTKSVGYQNFVTDRILSLTLSRFHIWDPRNSLLYSCLCTNCKYYRFKSIVCVNYSLLTTFKYIWIVVNVQSSVTENVFLFTMTNLY